MNKELSNTPGGPMWRFGMSEEDEMVQLTPYSDEQLLEQYDYWYGRGFSGEAMRRWREIERRGRLEGV